MAPRKMATMIMAVTYIKRHQNIQVVNKTIWQTTTSLKEDSSGQEEKNNDKKQTKARRLGNEFIIRIGNQIVKVQYFLEFHLRKQNKKQIFMSYFIMPSVIEIGNDKFMIKNANQNKIFETFQI